MGNHKDHLKYLTILNPGLKLDQVRVLPDGRARRTFSKMQWNRSNTIGLAKASCTICRGYGMKIRKTTEVPCNCVMRAIFRACYNRFRECDALSERTSEVSLEYFPGADRLFTYSRKREEYMCDFDLVSRRALNSTEQKIFR